MEPRILTFLMDAVTAESPEIRPLTKTFPEPVKSGWGATAPPSPRSFLGGREMNSGELEYASHEQLAACINEVADIGACLSTGRMTKQLVAQSRAGATPQNQPTDLLVLDIDGMNPATCSQLLAALGLSHVSHVKQYSASQGMPNKPGLRAHLFFMLDRTYRPSALRATLEHHNLAEPFLRDQLELSAHGLSLVYPLDITSADSGRLVYVAPPILNGNPDPFAPGGSMNPSITADPRPRISVVTKSTDLATIKLRPAPSRNRIMAEVNLLRTAQHLPEHALPPIKDGEHAYVMRGVDPTHKLYNMYRTSAGRKELTRFSLVVGERDPYYYAAFRPDIVRSFAEPGICYYLHEMCPEHYYQEAVPYANEIRAAMEPPLPPFEPVVDVHMHDTPGGFKK